MFKNCTAPVQECNDASICSNLVEASSNGHCSTSLTKKNLLVDSFYIEPRQTWRAACWASISGVSALGTPAAAQSQS